MSTSNLTISIEIEHADGLTVDAQAMTRAIARQVAFVAGLSPKRRGQKVAGFGRVALIGPEDGDNVRVTLVSAAMTMAKSAPKATPKVTAKAKKAKMTAPVAVAA